MIAIKVGVGQSYTRQIFTFIERSLWQAFSKSCEIVAKMHKELQGNIIKEKAKNSSGRLYDSIMVQKVEDRQGMIRYDVIVTAPYAAWVQWGRDAPIGLPYSKSGGKDFSKSKFSGHYYATEATKLITDNNLHIEIIRSQIFNELKKLGGRYA